MNKTYSDKVITSIRLLVVKYSYHFMELLTCYRFFLIIYVSMHRSSSAGLAAGA